MKQLLLASILAASVSFAQPITGLWSATVTVNNQEIPFRMGFSSGGGNAKGWFFNGDEQVPSTSGALAGGQLTLLFDHYATQLDATLCDGELRGTYGKEGRSYAFRAIPVRADDGTATDAPSIAGLWEVAVNSAKGERAWHLVVKQDGAEVSAAILRVDGDTGALTGRYQNGKFVLSHFSGARPALMSIVPRQDGSLEVTQNGKALIAIRAEQARAEGLPAPDDPMQHTAMKEPHAALSFRYPDLNGEIVSSDSLRFRNKVVLVAIGGSWCPNCHDEAPYLEDLYRRYHSAGLEVVGLSFEEADQLKDPSRLRAFVKQYGIKYPVLLAGEPAELNEKLPGVANLNAWPTTFFVGRDGRVRAIHTGFAGRASGVLHDEMVKDMEGILLRLLAENTLSQAY